VLGAKCTVLVIQHHCGQTFSTHLGGKEVCSPARRGYGAQPRGFFLAISVNCVWQYICPILMGLGTVLEEKPDNHWQAVHFA